MKSEIEMFATGAHLAMAMIHAEAAIRGQMPPSRRGAAICLHLESIGYNWTRPDNRADVAKHIAALAQLLLCPDDPLLNTLIAIYDSRAAVRHARRL